MVIRSKEGGKVFGQSLSGLSILLVKLIWSEEEEEEEEGQR